jgi:glycosyltransferase involved in cell wall biosynthesis
LVQEVAELQENYLVSVIIPVYNGGQYLADAIGSVLSQTCRPVEIIVVDDGSTDNSAEIAQSYARVHYFYQPNQGVSVARNTGIAAAEGDFIAFLDADDQWPADKLTRQVDFLLENPEVGYVVTHQRILLEQDAPIPSRFKIELLHKDHPGFVPSTLMVRRAVLEQVGGFDPTYLNAGEDIEWFSRAKDAGMLMAVLPETLLFRRMHKTNISLQSRPDFSRLLKTLKKSIDRQAAKN